MLRTRFHHLSLLCLFTLSLVCAQESSTVSSIKTSTKPILKEVTPQESPDATVDAQPKLNDDAPTTEAPEPTTQAPETTPAVPKTTTAEPSTTTPEPATTTPEPTTTTPEPTTTTPEPTTTTKEPKTTTVKPTTPSPKPPKPTVETFSVKDADGNICLRLQALASLDVKYFTVKGEESTTSVHLKDQKIESSGKCENMTESIELKWTPKNGTKMWTLKVLFERLANSLLADAVSGGGSFSAKTIELNFDQEVALFPGANYTGPVAVSAEGRFFRSQLKTFYACKAKETVFLAGKDEKKQPLPGVNLYTTDLQVEAFREKSKDDRFIGKKSECDADSSSSNVIPIAVGVSLAVLIIIALVTFLIGSRRRANNYESI